MKIILREKYVATKISKENNYWVKKIQQGLN